MSERPQSFAYSKTFAEAQKDPIIVFHSSGSTGKTPAFTVYDLLILVGNPKLVTMTHGTFSVTDNDRYMPTPEGRKPQNGAQFNFEVGGRFISCFPPYHVSS